MVLKWVVSEKGMGVGVGVNVEDREFGGRRSWFYMIGKWSYFFKFNRILIIDIPLICHT